MVRLFTSASTDPRAIVSTASRSTPSDEKLKGVYGHGDIGWQRDIEASYGMIVRHLEPVRERRMNE